MSLHINLSGEGPLLLAAFAAYVLAFAVMAAGALGRRAGKKTEAKVEAKVKPAMAAAGAVLASDAGGERTLSIPGGEESGGPVPPTEEELGKSPPACVGPALFALGFLAAVAAVIVRWVRVGHVPLQNIYEVLVALAPAAFLLWMVGRRLGLPGQAWDALLGVIVLFPAAFILDARPQQLPPPSRAHFSPPTWRRTYWAICCVPRQPYSP